MWCTRRDYSRLCRSPRWGRRRFALAMSRARRSARTYSPDDANKKPQLKSWGLIFGAPGGIRTPDQVVRSHLLYPAELRVLEVVLSVT